jgi:simple sugar transport system ATP-binding protein
MSPSINTADATIERIGEWMSGLWPKAGEGGAAAAASHPQITAGVRHAQA